MISAIITAFVSFASTNIDDIFVLMLFFSQVGKAIKKGHIIIGQYLGITTLLIISTMGAIGLNLIPHQYTGLLGIIPILLGIKEWLKYRKDEKKIVNITVEDNHIIENSEINTLEIKEIIETEVQVKSLTLKEICNPKDNVIDELNIDRVQRQITKNEKIKIMLSKWIHPTIINVFLVTIANGADNIGVYIPLFTTLDSYELIVTIVIFLSLIGVWCFVAEALINIPSVKHTIQKYKNIIVPVVFIIIGIFILVESDLFSLS